VENVGTEKKRGGRSSDPISKRKGGGKKTFGQPGGGEKRSSVGQGSALKLSVRLTRGHERGGKGKVALYLRGGGEGGTEKARSHEGERRRGRVLKRRGGKGKRNFDEQKKGSKGERKKKKILLGGKKKGGDEKVLLFLKGLHLGKRRGG